MQREGCFPRPWLWIRDGEVWFGTLGVFWSPGLRGIELPSGRWIG